MKKILFFTALLSVACAGAATPPFKCPFGNDTTNFLTCVSPYHAAGDKLATGAMMRASVDEASVGNIDAMVLQPGMGMVPWWPSAVLPLAEQEAWFERHYGVKPENEYHDYLKSGGDWVGDFVAACRQNNRAAIVSLRLNDAHHLEYAWGDNGLKPRPWMVQTMTALYVEHPEWVLPPRGGKDAPMSGRGFNWKFEAPRDYKLALIGELLDRYDLDGIELDFMRAPNYFTDDMPAEERVRIMTDFIARVRALVDARNARDGKHRVLMGRVPALRRLWSRMGFDPAAFAKAGLSAMNVSASYCTTQQTPLAEIRAAAPDTPLYYELTHTAQVRPISNEYDAFILRRCTREMLATTARVAYARGADAVSAFNFVYYREHGPKPELRGPFCEPPFAALSYAADKAAVLKDEPAYFFYADGDNRDTRVKKAVPRVYEMDIVPPSDPNRTPRLRLMVLTEPERLVPEGTPAVENADRGVWRVTLNGAELRPVENVDAAYPYPTDIRAGFGQKAQYLAFAVPPALVKNGVNEISATLVSDTKTPVCIRWVELYYSAPKR